MSFYDVRQARPLGQGQQSPAASLTDPELARIVERYKRAVASRYRPLGPAEMAGMPHGRMFVSPKVDGETWFLIYDGDDVVLANPAGRVISGRVPVLDEARDHRPPDGRRRVVAGELFAIRDGARPRHDDLARALSGAEQAAVDRLGFMAFDLVDEWPDDELSTFDLYRFRLDALRTQFEGGRRVQAITTEEVRTREAVAALWERWVASGVAEGLVVRHEMGRTYKIKPVLHFDAVVLGYTRRGDAPDQTRSLLVGVAREDGRLQVVGSVGNLGPDDLRVALRERLQAVHAPATYRHASSDGALYQFVRPTLVVRVRASDAQAESADGTQVPRMVLSYQVGAGWEPVQKLPGVSVLSPVLEAVVEDGRVPQDVQMAPLLDCCLLPEAQAEAERVELPRSEILRREAYTKETKGRLAVRKLLVWKTNKEDRDPRYPAYVVHWTDYSPGRKEPLQRTVRRAPTETDAMALADGLVADGVKRGWERADEPADANADADA